MFARNDVELATGVSCIVSECVGGYQ